MARFDTLDEFKRAIELSTRFLLAGTCYSHVPYERVGEVRNQNRRLGLGLMGVHEWLLKRGKRYGKDSELREWLLAYKEISSATAIKLADQWRLAKPKGVRACAPTGSIGILAETTTGIEPLFCVAYKRRYKGPDGFSTYYQYVVDPTAQRLIAEGTDPAAIEDAYTLAEDVERRLAFQHWMQTFVDQSISSTINMSPWGSELNNESTVQKFGETLMKYLPGLRGITVYPDGARGGQPLVRVPYETAMASPGEVFVEQADVCDISGKGGSCGS